MRRLTFILINQTQHPAHVTDAHIYSLRKFQEF